MVGSRAVKPSIRKKDSVLGEVRKCPQCGDWWPLDREFWYLKPGSSDGFDSYCKACRAEYVRVQRRKKKERSLMSTQPSPPLVGPPGRTAVGLVDPCGHRDEPSGIVCDLEYGHEGPHKKGKVPLPERRR